MIIDKDGNIHLVLSRDDFENLLLALGFAAGAAERTGGADGRNAVLRLANKINEGNPQWQPYDLPTVDS